MVYGDHDFHDIERLSWLNGVTGFAHFVAILLMVASIVFVIRGLLKDDDRRRSGYVLVGSLRRLEVVAIIALVLYLASLPLSVLMSLLETPYLAIIFFSSPAYIFIAAMPLIIAHALNKNPTS